MLLIINLSSKTGAFPVQALEEFDSALTNAGFKKEIRSVVVPGKEFSVTYDGPAMEKNQIERFLQPIAERDQIVLSVEVEESVKFP